MTHTIEPFAAPPGQRAAAADAVEEAATALRAAQVELELAVVAYRRTGVSMAVIAAAAGYSPPGILGILQRYGVK